MIVTEPGVYGDMPDDVYHSDPVPGGSLSSTGARRILPPGCPARYRHDTDNPPPSRPEFDLGKAFHTEVLGTGAPTAVIDAGDWKSRAAREARDAAYAAGLTPLLTHQAEQVTAMAAAVRRHPLAAALLTGGAPEQSAFWTDPATGVWRRARFDYLRPREVVDLKSCDSADEEHLRRAVHRYGYDQQAAFYLDAVRDLDLCPDPAFLFVFVEKAAPHLVHVAQLDPEALHHGNRLNRQAIDLYAECRRTDTWPAYSDDITTVSLPPYAIREDLP